MELAAEGWGHRRIAAELGRLMEGVRALAVEWERRHGSAEPWRVVNMLTGGSLLATNRTSLLAAERASGWMAASTDSEVPHGP